MVVDAGPPDVRLARLEGEPLLGRHMPEHAKGLGHHLGSNVVSCQDGEL